MVQYDTHAQVPPSRLENPRALPLWTMDIHSRLAFATSKSFAFAEKSDQSCVKHGPKMETNEAHLNHAVAEGDPKALLDSHFEAKRRALPPLQWCQRKQCLNGETV